MSSKDGKRFEEDIAKSASNQNLFNFRIRDVDHTSLKKGRAVPRNKYDFILYNKPYLFPMELKSTESKSISYSESNPKIKEHQIEALTEDSKFDGVVAGFLFNFREPNNKVYFVHIDDFNHYRKAAKGEVEHTYEGRMNEQSIPLHIVEQIGVEVKGVKKQTRYTYMVKKTLEELIKKYG